jgi:alpha-N-acetylglucosaminidase
MFFDSVSWTKERARALLSGIPKGRVLVLDLYSEKAPCYTKYESYFGQPFIWNMLHNFGGVSELRGSFEAINKAQCWNFTMFCCCNN